MYNSGIASEYISMNRDQRFLLPPDMSDWLPENDLVWVVIDIVTQLDTSGLHAIHPLGGVGRRAYNPDMMLTLLFYAYCRGERSSRRIEQLCHSDIGYRVACANTIPDHATIARFRVQYRDVAESLFVDMLAVCGRAGLVDAGIVAIDGTKISGAAALRANLTQTQIDAELVVIAAKVFGDAEDADNHDETPSRDHPPRRDTTLDRGARKQRLTRAAAELASARHEETLRTAQLDTNRAALQAENAAKGHLSKGRAPRGQQIAKAEARVERERQRDEQSRAEILARAQLRGDRRYGSPRKTPGGKVLRAAEEKLARLRTEETARLANTAKPSSRTGPVANTTDPESRLMKSVLGWIQGYNAQAAANEKGIIIAVSITQEHNDFRQCIPMMKLVTANLSAAGIKYYPTLLFDAGYHSEDNIKADGPDRLIAYTKSWKLKTTDPTTGPPPANATPIETMNHRLRTPEGANLYRKRQHTIETAFGDIKENRRFRRFMLRSLQKVQAEWSLICLTQNIKKLAATQH